MESVQVGPAATMPLREAYDACDTRHATGRGIRMRLFIAAELPEQMLEALSETSAILRECVRGRYVAPDSFHVTLAFLGAVPHGQVPDAIQALEMACAGQGPVDVSLGALGSFGKAHRATLWQGFSRGVDELSGLAGDIREELAACGLPYDGTLFVPHVTLMRKASIEKGVLPMPVVEKGVIDSVALMSSDLSGDRPRYEALHRVTLAEVTDDDAKSEEGIDALWA